MAKILHILQNNSLLDISGNGYNDGTFTAGASRGFVKSGLGMGALKFDGANSTLITTLTASGRFQNGFTIRTWIKAQSLGESNLGSIVSKAANYWGGGGGFAYGMVSSTGNKLYLRINDAVQSVISGVIALKRYCHAVVTCNSAGLVTHYLDHVVSGTPATSSQAPSAITNSKPITIGNGSDIITLTFDGELEEVLLEDTVWTQTQVDSDYEKFIIAKKIGNIVTPIRGFTYPDPANLNESGLVAAWNMNSVGASVADISGNFKTGTLTRVEKQKGIRGNSLRFNGVTSNFTFTATSLLTTFSAAAWMKTTTTSIRNIFSSNSDINAGAYLSILQGGSSAAWYDGNDWRTGTTVVNDGEWHHLVYVFNNKAFYIYIDGVLEYDNTAGNGTYTSGDFAFIGRLYSGTRIYNGLLDEPRIWNKVLTAQEVRNEYNKIANQTVLFEDFTNEGADEIVKVPQGWRNGTTTAKIGELTTKYNSGLPRGKKYLQLSGIGTMIMTRVNLDEYLNNGYLSYDYYKASNSTWSTRSGNINTPVLGVVYTSATKILTFTSDAANDRITNIKIQFGITR